MQQNQPYIKQESYHAPPPQVVDDRQNIIDAFASSVKLSRDKVKSADLIAISPQVIYHFGLLTCTFSRLIDKIQDEKSFFGEYITEMDELVQTVVQFVRNIDCFMKLKNHTTKNGELDQLALLKQGKKIGKNWILIQVFKVVSKSYWFI